MAQDTSVYLGRPGFLEKIQIPRSGLQSTVQRSANTYQLASGGARGDRLLHGRRKYQLSYGGLGYQTFEQIASYVEGLMGPGPFILLDPGQRNMLSRNQSATTGHTNGTDGWHVSNTADIGLAVATGMGSHPGALRVNWKTNTPAAPTVYFDAPASDWFGTVPCALRPHSFGFWINGGVGSSTVQATIVYMDAAGATLSTTFGTAVASVVGSWSLVKVENVLPPAGTVYVSARLFGTSATIAATEFLLVSHAILNEGATLDSPWTPGTGIYPVMLVSQDDAQPGYDPAYRTSHSLVLQEIGG